MNKGELISKFATAANVKNADAKNFVEQFAKVVEDSLKAGEEVTIPGVGKLKVKTRPARNGRNPATGVAIAIPEKRVVKFEPASKFNDDFSATAAA
jgi:nucleoid DNA-binding protein